MIFSPSPIILSMNPTDMKLIWKRFFDYPHMTNMEWKSRWPKRGMVKIELCPGQLKITATPLPPAAPSPGSQNYSLLLLVNTLFTKLPLLFQSSHSPPRSSLSTVRLCYELTVLLTMKDAEDNDLTLWHLDQLIDTLPGLWCYEVTYQERQRKGDQVDCTH